MSQSSGLGGPPGASPSSGGSDLDRAVELLAAGGHACVLCRGEEALTSELPGVAPLVGWLRQGVDLAGFSAADKVVGRAAALLYAHAGVRAVYAVLASEGAAPILAAHGIAFRASATVPAILNRPRTASCPMEALVAGTDDPAEATRLLLAAVPPRPPAPSA